MGPIFALFAIVLILCFLALMAMGLSFWWAGGTTIAVAIVVIIVLAVIAGTAPFGPYDV